MPLSRIKSQMEDSQFRLDSSAASTDINERLLLDGTDGSATDAGFAVILETATDNADVEVTSQIDNGVFNFSSPPKNVANPAFKVSLSANQTLSNNSDTVVEFDTIVYDVGGYFDTSTYRYTPQISGYYQIVVATGSNNAVDIQDHNSFIALNGSIVTQARMTLAGLTNDDIYLSVFQCEDVIFMNGTTDYIEGKVRLNSEDGSSPIVSSISFRTFMLGNLLVRTP